MSNVPIDTFSKLRVINLEKTAKKEKRPKREPKQNLSSLSKKERKELKYSQFEPLYRLWLQYAEQMLPEGKKEDDRLLRMEWLGALMMVTEADNQSMIGLVGLVVIETRYTIQLITKDDKCLIIPKAGTVFQTAFKGKILTLFGDAMRFRPSQRGRKSRLRSKLPFSLR